MMPSTERAIQAVLARHPEGITAKAAALELGWKATATSQRMGRLAIQDIIARSSPVGRVNNMFVYHAKPPAPIAPTLQRWVPERTLIAGRMIANV